MKSLEARFNEVDADPKYEGNASIIKFFYAVKDGNFTKRTVQQWFNKLVDKGDYDRVDKPELVEYALQLTDGETRTTAKVSKRPSSRRGA